MERSDHPIAERTVREYVQFWKLANGKARGEIFIPQAYDPGIQAQVDWYEAVVELAGERLMLQFFSLRSMWSGAAFHQAYLHATQQAFLAAHQEAFHYFGGVFHQLRYDNLTSAVKKILRGRRREETDRSIAFRSHWQFDASFCTPGKGHEKGGVEGEAGYFRRNHLVPVPQASSLATLNESLLEACRNCRGLRLPTVAAQSERLAQEAARANQSHLNYLAELLGVEMEEREYRKIERRIKEARLPRMKTLEDFDFSAASHLSVKQVHALAEGSYLERAEPVILIWDSGTGKTHLASGLCLAACKQKKRARFVTAAGLINELVEAQQHNLLSRALQRWARYDLIVLDEVGYVPFAQVGAELFFQVISERAEKATLIITTNLPFSEWTQVFPSARLCKALLDRITDRAHIIETGTESYRFKRTVEAKKKAKE